MRFSLASLYSRRLTQLASRFGTLQFMNFGYAIALAVVIMYWPYLTLVEPYWYLFTVFGCYFIFLYNLSALLPQFTLCTSLGYLTNQKQLHDDQNRPLAGIEHLLQRGEGIGRHYTRKPFCGEVVGAAALHLPAPERKRLRGHGALV